jgi:Leucine-rich repeat (LRR) protein
MKKLRWYQYRLRSLLLLMLFVAIGMSWFAAKKQQAERQRKAVEEIERIGGSVFYDYQYDSNEDTYDYWVEAPHGPEWLKDSLGNDFFANVVVVDLQSSIGYSNPSIKTQFEHLKGSVAGLPNVETLHLSYEEVTDTELEYFNSLSKLKRLSIYAIHITDSGLKNLEGFHQLQYLTMEYCSHLSDTGFEHLANLNKLKELNVYETNISDTGLRYLKDLKSLEHLELTSHEEITGDGLQYLRDKNNLKYVDLSKNHKLADAGLQFLKNKKNLEYLFLCEDKNLTGVGLKYLEELKNLQVLRLDFSGITGEGMECLNGLAKLTELGLQGTNITDKGILLSKLKCNIKEN